MATLKDVAKAAGVSVATVSCAITGAKPVKPETKAKIEDAIAALKYVPNSAARNLKATVNRTIGIVLPNMKSRLYTEIFDGLSSYLQSHGYAISIAFSNDSPDIEMTKTDEFISSNVAGLIIITCQPDNTEYFRTHILDYDVPVIFLERMPTGLTASFIGFKNHDTMYELTRDLVKKGYHDLAVVCGPTEFSSEWDCIQGVQDALEEFQMELPKRRIVETNLTREDAFNNFMLEFSHDVPEVILTTSREISLGIQTAALYCNYAVPDQLIILGLCEESWTDVTKQEQMFLIPRSATGMGERAARILLQNIESPSLFEPVFIEIEDSHNDTQISIPTYDAARIHRPQNADKNRTLRLLTNDTPTASALKLLINHFSEETGISVEITMMNVSQLLDIISHSTEELTAKYDLYTFDVPWLEYMAQNLCLADLTHFIENDIDKHRLFPGALRNCQIDNRYFGIPFSYGTQLLFYRKDLFESLPLQREYQKKYQISLRPPRTWKEFNGIAKFFTRSYNDSSPTEYGTSFAGISDEELAPELLIRLWSYGGSLWDSYNRPTFNTKEMVAAFESMQETLTSTQHAPVDTSITQTIADFCSGKTAMLITYSEYAQLIRQQLTTNITGRVGFHTIPGDHPASVGWNLGLNPFSAKREDAFTFMKWLCKWDTSFYMTIMNGGSPATSPYHNQELVRLYPWMSYIEKGNRNATRRNSPYRKHLLVISQIRIEKILCRAFHDVFEQGVPVEEALLRAQEEANHLFKSYGYPIIRAR